jgi:hypothetical protein
VKRHWQDWLNVLVGAWLFFSPWLLKYSTMEKAAWDSYILGAAIALFALWTFFVPKAWEEWTIAILGVWLVASPLVLGFSSQSDATWNIEIVGAAVMIFAGFTLPFWRFPSDART